MTWVIVAIVLVAVIALAAYTRREADRSVPPGVLVGLHAIRARVIVARYRREARRDAVSVRRELRQELRELRRRP